MLNLHYYQAESCTRPSETDTESSPTTVYLRRNIRTEQRADVGTVYVYEEAKIPKSEYNVYLTGKTQADIAYLYMMTGVDYE